MRLASPIANLVGGRVADEAGDEAAGRLVGTTRSAVDELIRRRGVSIAAAADVFRLRHRGLAPDRLEEALIADRRWRSATRGAALAAPSVLPSVKLTIDVATAGVDAVATILDQAELVIALCHLRGLDVRQVDQRRHDVLLALGLEEGVLRLDRGRLWVGKDAIERADLERGLDDEEVARINRALGERVLHHVVRRRTRGLVGRLLPFGVGVALAATSDWKAIRSVGKATTRYLDWRQGVPDPPGSARPRG